MSIMIINLTFTLPLKQASLLIFLNKRPSSSLGTTSEKSTLLGTFDYRDCGTVSIITFN